MRTKVSQRLRVTFGIDEPLKYVSILDLGRVWERTLRRAHLPIAYTQGFNPHPRLQFASALPVGYSSDCELVDIRLATATLLEIVARALESSLAPGLRIVAVEEVQLDAVSPQASMRQAAYHVELWTDADEGQIAAALACFLSRPEIRRHRTKKGRLREYDLVPLVISVTYRACKDGCHELTMIMVNDSTHGSGRPEDVVEELGLDIYRYAIRRTALVWGDEEGSR